jgi:hypothetical protein
MPEQSSRLQLLEELRRLDREHTAAARGMDILAASAFDELLQRYSYSELKVIADFLAADVERLRSVG